MTPQDYAGYVISTGVGAVLVSLAVFVIAAAFKNGDDIE